MSGKEGARIFVGGLSWETTERDLEAAFGRFGKVLDAQDDLLGCFGILSCLKTHNLVSQEE